jgi:photosystem II stability/assembly factor-like uncharacterized protein
MRSLAYPILLLFSTIFISCLWTGKAKQPHTSGAERLKVKMEPSDWFSMQRSWPDESFDEQAWQKRIIEAQNNQIDERSQSQSQWVSQGAGNVPGRVNTLSAHPKNPNIILCGYATGGIFKTTNGGDSWYPVFDQMPMLSISDITYDVQNPQVVYAATGDPQVTINPVNGRGIFKSTDGGETWNYLGLNDVGIITKIVVSSTQSQVLYAGVQGNPFVRNEARGVYKSVNGGITWQKVLYISTQAGASDLVINPQNPDILYASFWERIRNNTESVNWGTNAKIFKTTNGGNTWQELTNGLPSGVLCRTGICISAMNPDKLYAVFVDTFFRPQGLYKTIDAGQNWTSMPIGGLNDAFGNFGWYFGKVRCNDFNDEEVYIPGILLRRKSAGSDNWQVAAGAHADLHDLIFLPDGTRFLASDGGVYRNKPGAFIWELCENMATTQVYHVAVDPFKPYRYWIGAQDNGTNVGGKTTGDNLWQQRFGGDGFDIAFHPTDSMIMWIQTQNGGVHQSMDGGQNFNFNATCLGTTDRCGWDTPIHKSIHNPDFLYSATYRAYISPSANGLSWSPLSPDLTDGVIYGPRFHVVSTIKESPIIPELLFAGTSDGNVWRSGAAGNWVNITAGLPNRFVTSVHGSPSSATRIFVTHSGFRDDAIQPHIHRSDNLGTTWTDISSNLPQVPVNDIHILAGHQDTVLIAATDAGVYRSKNSGQSWTRLGNNLPNVIISDIEHNTQLQELVIATFGRGVYTMTIADLLSENPPSQVQVGAVRTAYPSPVPMQGAKVFVSNQQFGLTNQSGFFTLSNPPSTGLLQFKKDTIPTNGVDVLDVLKVQRHILALEPFDTPYKLIAADVNRSKSVTSADIIALRKLILGADTAFQNVPSWQFVTADLVFQNIQNPWLDSITTAMPMTDISAGRQPAFVAIKSGDVTGGANPNTISPGNDERTKAKFEVQIIDESSNTVIIALAPGHRIMGAQWTLESDYEIEQIEALSGPLEQSWHQVSKQMVSFCFSHLNDVLQPDQDGFTRLFRVKYRKEEKGGTAIQTARTWRFTDRICKSIVIDGDWTEKRAEICRRLNQNEKLSLPVLHIMNNPLVLGQDCSIQLESVPSGILQITNAQGSRCFESTATDGAMTIPAFAFKQRGVYLISCKVGQKQVVEKLVVI